MIRRFSFVPPLTRLAAVIAFVVLLGVRVEASKLKQLELAKLPDLAQVVALAEVLRVDEKSLDSRGPSPYDEITIRVVSVIKGSLAQEEIKVVLQSRGAKNFDPVLKVGDAGVFFLREIDDSRAKLAYSGSVAIFQKPNFVVSEKTKRAKQMDTKPTKVKLVTTMGDIVVELNEKAAPVTVKNFLTYVEEGFYDGTIFHRVIPKFMIQGGGFTPDMRQKKTRPPIINESNNGLKNNRGTIAMARTPRPDSATSQFFINHKNNAFLNYAGPDKPGYAVFGKVVEGMEVLDKIAAVKTAQRSGRADVPVKPVVIKSAKVVSGE